MKDEKPLQKNEHLHINLHQNTHHKPFYINGFIIHELLFCILIIFIISSFSMTTNFLLAFVLSQLFMICLHLNIEHIKVRRYAMYSISILLVLSLIFLNRYVMNGMYIVYEQVTHTLAIQMGKISYPFELTVNGKEVMFAEQLFSIYFLFGIVLFTYFMTRLRSNLFVILFMLSVVVFQIWTNITPSIVVQILFFLMMFIVYILFNIGEKQSIKESMTIGVTVLLLFGGIYGSIQLITPYSAYEKQSIIKQAEDQLLTTWDDFRFEKKRTNNFTNGNFSQLEPLDVNEEIALEVMMSHPTSFYLRGFVGASYTSKQWEELDAEKYDDAFDMLYWLEKEAFHPMEQLHTLKQLVDEEEETEINNISIQNINGSSKYFYTPYELSSLPKERYDTFAELDQTFLSNAFFGDRHYTFNADENLVTQYPTLANKLYNHSEKSDELTEYIKYESYYNDFVYDVYTEVPENISMLMENHIGTVQLEDDNEHVPYEWAINKVTNYLEDNIAYEADVSTFSMEEDFLMEFLENERKGYAPHFATAATVMFRHLGIPARYVEGYLVPPEKVEEADPYEKIAVNGTNAHAWTEIYIDQVGWIPVEVTPGFEDVMEKIDLSNYPSGASESDVESMYEEPEDGFNDAKQELEDDSFIDETNNEPKDSMHWIYWLFIIIGIILLIALIGYIIYIWRRRMKLKKFIQDFRTGDIRTTSHNVFSYVTFLLRYDDIQITGGSISRYIPQIEQQYGEEYRMLFESAWNVQQLAVYSNVSLSEEERNTLLEFYTKSLHEVVSTKSFLQKLKMKYVDVAYINS